MKRQTKFHTRYLQKERAYILLHFSCTAFLSTTTTPLQRNNVTAKMSVTIGKPRKPQTLNVPSKSECEGLHYTYPVPNFDLFDIWTFYYPKTSKKCKNATEIYLIFWSRSFTSKLIFDSNSLIFELFTIRNIRNIKINIIKYKIEILNKKIRNIKNTNNIKILKYEI